jgi:hypothetical protein
MIIDPQSAESGATGETNKRKLQHFLDFLELKFENGTEYQIDNTTLQYIIDITVELAKPGSQPQSLDPDLPDAISKVRNSCGAALSLYQQPTYREIYMDQLATIPPALRELISLL